MATYYSSHSLAYSSTGHIYIVEEEWGGEEGGESYIEESKTGLDNKQEVRYPEEDQKTVVIPGDLVMKIHPCTTLLVMVYNIVHNGMQRLYQINAFYSIRRPDKSKKLLSPQLFIFFIKQISDMQTSKDM